MVLSPASLDVVQIIRLVTALSRMQDNSLERFAQAAWGLTAGQMRLIINLTPGESARTLELAHRLFTDPGTVSGLLRRLTRKQVVSTRQSTEDRRVQLVSLTPEGERIRADFFARCQTDLPVHKVLLSLHAQERQELRRLLIHYATQLIGGDEVEALLERAERALRTG